MSLRSSAPRKTGSLAEFEARTYTDSAGTTLPYRLLKPHNYDASERYPLVLFLHGAGERGSDNAAQLKHCVGLFTEAQNRDKFPCFVVVPQCPSQRDDEPWGWTGARPWDQPYRLPKTQGDPARMTLEIIHALQKEFSIDPHRLYLAGISMGGFGIWDILAHFPPRSTPCIWSSFNAGEFLFPESRLSVVPMVLMCGALLALALRASRSFGVQRQSEAALSLVEGTGASRESGSINRST